MIDVIVPTVPGRERSLERLKVSLQKVTPDHKLNFIIIKDSETCGGGWRQGLRDSSAKYVLLACDDQEFISKDWAWVAIETVERGGLPCPRVWTPGGEVESNGGDMHQLHHLVRRRQKDFAPVDYTTIPFMSQRQALDIGMIDVHYCSDVWVSYRGRQLGIGTVLRHGFDVTHHHAMEGRGAGMTQFERDQMDSETLRKELECASSSPVH